VPRGGGVPRDDNTTLFDGAIQQRARALRRDDGGGVESMMVSRLYLRQGPDQNHFLGRRARAGCLGILSNRKKTCNSIPSIFRNI